MVIIVELVIVIRKPMQQNIQQDMHMNKIKGMVKNGIMEIL